MTASELIQRIAASQCDWSQSIFDGEESPVDWLADSTDLDRLRNQETIGTELAPRVWIGPCEPIQGQTVEV